MKEELKGIVKESLNYKKLGNEYFSKHNFSLAIENYKKALINLNLSSEFKELLSQTNIDSIKIECLNNIAICYLVKQKDYEMVLDYTQQALDIQKKNYKSLYIKSKALKKLNRWEEALEVIKMVRLLY